MQVIITQPSHKLTYLVQLEHEGRNTDLTVFGPIRGGRSKMSDANCFNMASEYANKVANVLKCEIVVRESEV